MEQTGHVIHVVMLISRWQISLLLLMLLTSCSAQSTYYVTPTPDTPCPGEPCHTLSEYVAGQYFNNLPVNTTMEFLPGNHTLEQTISVTNLTWVTLHGDSSSLPEVTSRIECTWPAGCAFTNIAELHISALAFISCGHHNSAAVTITSVQQSDISDCAFQNSSNTKYYHPDTQLGGALFLKDSTLTLTGNTFQSNFADFGGALYVVDSTLNSTRNTFQNSAGSFGGALYVVDSTLNVTGNTFQNSAGSLGGALYVEDGTLNFTGNTFQSNSAGHDGGALYVVDGTFNFTGNTFQYNSAGRGGALYVVDGTFNFPRNTFQNNSAGGVGGALYVVYGTFNFTRNTFQNNSASTVGGALYVGDGTLNFTGNTFQNNSAGTVGGALHVDDGTVNLTGNTFQSNSADAGGALCVWHGTFTFIGNTFQNNSAGHDGGALCVWLGTHNFTENTFQNNSAGHDGGALHVRYGTFNFTGNTFQSNSAAGAGGALHVDDDDGTFNFTRNTFQNNSAASSGGALRVRGGIHHYIGNKFQKNYAALGGTLHIVTSNVNFTDDCFTNSYAQLGGAILATDNSIVKMYNITIGNNRAEYGGGMAAVDSQLEVLEKAYFENNRASYGGGLYVHNTEFNGSALFNKNSVTKGGGGIYASRSTFYLTDNTMIIANNSAVDGGGVLLSGDSKLYQPPGTAIHLISNSAKSTGGAIKVEESSPLTYCITTEGNVDASNSDCFFQIQQNTNLLYTFHQFKKLIARLNVRMYFDNNSAVDTGTDLYGGSVDNCTLNSFKFATHYYGSRAISGYFFDVITENKSAISSDPLHICTCRDGQTNCTGSYHPGPVYPGGTLEVPVIAHGQRNGTTPAVMHVTDTSNNVSISILEGTQNIDNSCNTLTYTIQSRAVGTTQEMTLYAQGPCSPTQSNTLTVTMNIQNCPPGFQLSMNEPICICAERLQHFTNTCLVDSTTVLREHNAEFWVGYDNSNESRGLILHPNCPFDYCTSEETYLAVDDSDKQCNYNRSGLLCGRCSENLSLALGSSRCLQCSNSYLSLLAAFAFAGIALVLLLLVTRLTVAAGTINGLVFYANIVAVNSAIFFQPQITNVPTGLMANVLRVFIAWLNLDLGIQTCFYNGMDAYVKIWMQFAFPLYVWTLVGMIIVGSYYSGRVASIFGRNPIAVLATLFLLSYAKLLRTVIAVLSYTSLEYPNNSQIAVWLYDGNIRYLSGKHIPLFIAAMICLIFLFLPYTMLLIFSQWLQAKSHLRMFSRINSRYVKPFLDAYHAPYTNKHRYWTGLMLLLRFVLFLISAVNALGDPSVNLLVIASTTVLMLPTILGSRIYKTWTLGLLETSFIINLIILAVAALYIRPNGGNQNAATFTSVGIAFATFHGIVIYHSVQQIKGTRLWKRLRQRHDYRVPLAEVHVDSGPEDPPDRVFMSRYAPTCTVVDMRELREPCMATD